MNIYDLKFLKNKQGAVVISFVFVIVIGILDYITTSDFSFSIFYIIPIAFLALMSEVRRTCIISLCVLSTILWFISDYDGRAYDTLFFPIWNSLVRFCIFLIIGITLLKNNESNRKQKELNKKLQHSNDEKNRIIGIAAHDLRSPMGMVINLIEYIKSDSQIVLHAKLGQLFNLLHTISQNSLAMINNLLDISKIESGKIELKLSNLDYVSFMKEQLVYNNLIANKKNIVISLKCEVDSIVIDIDRTYMTQVVNNLLSNAIKFSERGSEVFVLVSKDNDAIVRTEVVDSGKGIKKEEQELLFNYFQKTSTTSTEGEASTGLGLAIVKKIIQAHAGTVGVISENDKGATFYFTLPIIKT